MPTKDKKSATTKSTTKKTASAEAEPAKKARKSGKPSNTFLAENPPPKMRGSRK